MTRKNSKQGHALEKSAKKSGIMFNLKNPKGTMRVPAKFDGTYSIFCNETGCLTIYWLRFTRAFWLEARIEMDRTFKAYHLANVQNRYGIPKGPLVTVKGEDVRTTDVKEMIFI